MYALDNRTALTAVGSIRDAKGCRWAADLVSDGQPVGGFVRSVCAIFVDAENPDAIEAIYRIKGEGRVGRPLSSVLSTTEFVQMIDPDEVPEGLRDVVLDAAELEARFGSLGFIRVPIRREAAEALPPSVVSRTPDGKYRLQNYIPSANDSVQLLVKEMAARGVKVPAATSMNLSGQPEIVEQYEGIAFCKAQAIPLFLADYKDSGRVRGSFSIVSIDRTGVKLLREGQFPGYLVKHLFGCEVDTTNAAPAKYPVVRTHCERCAGRVSPRELHDEIVEYLDSGTSEN
jgi:tRNA A37 threonylcarbamoyladenosine synthetase subunit TsaC/SUA5/YrdC